MEEATIIFQPSGHRGKIPRGKSLLDAAQGLGENIESLCGGKGSCGKCKILIAEGRYPKHGVTSSCKHLSGWQEAEARFIRDVLPNLHWGRMKDTFVYGDRVQADLEALTGAAEMAVIAASASTLAAPSGSRSPSWKR